MKYKIKNYKCQAEKISSEGIERLLQAKLPQLKKEIEELEKAKEISPEIWYLEITI